MSETRGEVVKSPRKRERRSGAGRDARRRFGGGEDVGSYGEVGGGGEG